MSLAYINPKNEDPDVMPNGDLIYSREICERVPGFFRAMAVCFFGLGLIGTVCVKRNPEYVEAATELQKG